MVRTIHSTNENCREFSRMKALYAISEAVREDLLKRQYDSIVVENGVPTSLIRQKKDYQLKKKFYQLVQVSRLYIKHKGQDILLQALKELIQNRGINNFQLHLIGDGESRRFLEKMVKDLSLEIFVVFEGAKTQEYIFEHLADYDCFVQPSRQEGFGLTVAEAMAAKLPVLVSNLDGPMEIVDNGRVGMLFERDNPIDLADKLEVILRGDYDYRMIEKAYERVVTMYDVSMTANKYIQEYRKIVG